MRFNQRTVFRGEDGEIYKAVRPPRDSVKVWKDETDDGVEATHVRVPISSTSEDRDGDEFTEDGLEHMVEQLQSGDVPMFLDHGISPETGFQDYRALEAVGGWKDGEIEDGVAYGIGQLDPDHDDAETLASRLENGIVPVGWSVGFIPHETEAKDEDDGERFLEHDLLEVSSVGIPSNPDGVSASIAQTAKALGQQRGVDVDAEELASTIGESIERAVEKQSEDDVELVDDAIASYMEEEEPDEPTVADFLEWVSSSKSEDELAVIAGVVEEYLEGVAEDDDAALEELADDEPLQSLAEWTAEQLESDEDDEEGDDEEEEEAGDGDGDEDDEDDEEEDDADTDDGDTITTDTVDAIVEGVGEVVGRELAEHREALLEQLDTEPEDTDADDGDGDEEGDDEDDEEEDSADGDDADSPDSSTSSFAGEPRAIASFGGSDSEERDASEDEEIDSEKDTGEPARPTFNPGTNSE